MRIFAVGKADELQRYSCLARQLFLHRYFVVCTFASIKIREDEIVCKKNLGGCRLRFDSLWTVCVYMEVLKNSNKEIWIASL